MKAKRKDKGMDIPPLKLAIIAVLSAAALTALMLSGIFADFELFASDKLYQRERPLDGNIFVIGIDEVALANIGPYNTWDRSIMTQVIDALNADAEAAPAVIGVDIMYFGDSDPQLDEALAEACGRYDNTVVASNIVVASEVKVDGDNFYIDNSSVQMVELPFDALKNVTTFGHINTVKDSDGYIRYSVPYIAIPEELRGEAGFDVSSSFALQIYNKYTQTLGLPNNFTPDVLSDGKFYIPYSAKPGGYSDSFSVWDIITGELPPEIFAGTIVLLGPYATGLEDSYNTPIDRVTSMYGVEIHANIVDAMLKNEYRRTVDIRLQAVVLFIVLLGLFYAFYYFHAAIAAAILAAVSGLYLLLATQMVFPFSESLFLFKTGAITYRYMLPVVLLPLSSATMYVGVLVFNFIKTLRQKKQVTDTFKKYVDPAIIDDIFASGIDNLNLGGRKADICVMFVDIRGFTPMSEVMTPEGVVEILGQYLELTSSAIFKHKGTLDKFIGDATMAFFNAPLPLDDYIYKSILTAWDIVQGGLALEKELLDKYGRTVSFGIGLHCGEAVVGNIGTPRRVDYTAIGNTVNTAARLESNARPAQILMSEAVYRAVEDRIIARCVGNIPLKGKSEELTVYALEHIKEYMDTYEPLASAALTPGK